MDVHEIHAVFLKQHPHIAMVADDGTRFWYDEEKGIFMCQKVKNKSRNGIYQARGMLQWYEYFVCRTGGLKNG